MEVAGSTSAFETGQLRYLGPPIVPLSSERLATPRRGASLLWAPSSVTGSKTGYVLKNGHPEGEFSELLPTIPPQQRAFIALKVVRLD